MKRRDFIRMTATASGLLLCGGTRLALAQQAFSGPYWLFIEARGGWDPTSFCDPKGFGLGVNEQPVRATEGLLSQRQG